MSYTVNGKEYDTFSAANQRIIDKLINREVFCCMTQEVEYMLGRVYENDENNPLEESSLDGLYVRCCENCGSSGEFRETCVCWLKDEEFDTGFFDFDEHWNQIDGYICPVCKAAHRTVEEARSCCGPYETVFVCDNCGCVFNEEEYFNLDTEMPEIYEWWAVSNWFGEELRECGQPVIEAWGKYYWGRTCTGQAISLDGCVARVAKHMGILEGMENDWSDFI